MKLYTDFRKRDYLYNVLQWAIVPVLTLTLFSFPAIFKCSNKQHIYPKRICSIFFNIIIGNHYIAF